MERFDHLEATMERPEEQVKMPTIDGERLSCIEITSTARRFSNTGWKCLHFNCVRWRPMNCSS
jgi:hypothetical protein